MPDSHRIVFNENGDVSAVFYDEIKDIIQALTGDDEMMVNRASHVEPDDKGQWWVDMSPVGGPNHLGPFNNREEALAYEVKELEKYGY